MGFVKSFSVALTLLWGCGSGFAISQNPDASAENIGLKNSCKSSASKDIEINPIAVFQTLSNAASEFGNENPDHAGIATVFSTVLSLFASLVKQDMEESSKRDLLRSVQGLCHSYSNSVKNGLDCVKQKEDFPILLHCSRCGSKEQQVEVVRELLTSGPEGSRAFVDELFGYVSTFITNRLNLLQKIALEIALNFLSEEAGVPLPGYDSSEVPDSLQEVEGEQEIGFADDDDIIAEMEKEDEDEAFNNDELVNSVAEVTEELSLMMLDEENESKCVNYPYLKKTINFTSDEEFSEFVFNIVSKGGVECKDFVEELITCAKDLLELQVDSSIKSLKKELLAVNFEPYRGLNLQQT
jgi:hypothetical protein